jgi:hypothetical protein
VKAALAERLQGDRLVVDVWSTDAHRVETREGQEIAVVEKCIGDLEMLYGASQIGFDRIAHGDELRLTILLGYFIGG